MRVDNVETCQKQSTKKSSTANAKFKSSLSYGEKLLAQILH